MEKEEIKEVALATTKGLAGSVPIVGSFLSEYIGLVNEQILNKREREWQASVSFRLSRLEIEVSELANDEFFYNAYQETMYGFLKSYEVEKRSMYVNALMNCKLQNLSEDKKMRFIRLLDMYTLNAVYLLRYFAKSHDEQPIQSGNMRMRMIGGTEKPYEKALMENTYLENDKDYLLSLAGQFASDGLLTPRDIIWEHPVSYDIARKKKTSRLGDEFLKFIDNGAI